MFDDIKLSLNEFIQAAEMYAKVTPVFVSVLQLVVLKV